MCALQRSSIGLARRRRRKRRAAGGPGPAGI